MKKITSVFSMLTLGLFLFMSCQPEANKIPPCYNGKLDNGEVNVDCGGDCPPCAATCTDGILNQGEEQIDCGGPCPLCASCTDGIQNGQETGVDCGGPNCPPCPANCTDLLMNGNEEGVDCGGDCPACDPNVLSFEATIDGTPMDSPTTNATIAVGVLNISGSAAGFQISLTCAADIDPGTYDIPASGVAATLNNASANPSLFTAESGSITIITHNKSTHEISGTFGFTANNGEDDVEVTDGTFSLTY